MTSPQSTIPIGYCQCGCGQLTRLAPRNRIDARHNWVKGHPLSYVAGHQPRSHPKPITDADYVATDTGYDSPCWLWLGCNKNGYALRSRKRVHRVMYELAHGPIPDGTELDHLCKVKLCVNPSHLEAVSHTENMRRAGKLRLEEVRQIRAAYTTGYYTKKALALLYGVTQQQIAHIVTSKQWRE